MKKDFFTIAVLSVSMFLTSCGGSEQPKQEEPAATETAASDLFTDDRPAYDASAIDPSAEVVSIEVDATGQSMSEMSYNPKTINVKAGTTIKLKLVNKSTDESMPHNWVLVFDGTKESVATAGLDVGKEGSYVPNIKDVLVATRLLGPGEETEITFPAPPAGTYEFVCTYPGHWSMMNGKFIVE